VYLALSIAGAVLVALSLPAVIEIGLFLFANLFLRPSAVSPGGNRSPAAVRKLALVVPAHDEAGTIQRCVSSLLAADAGPYAREVVVIADNCADLTAGLARAAGARVLERFDDTVKGKGAALNYCFSRLLGDYDAFVVVDADSVVDPSFVKVMGDRLAGGWDAVQCRYLALNVDQARKVRLLNLGLLSMNVFRPRGRELLGCSVGIMGNGFGLSRRLLAEVPYAANSITEDLEYHLTLVERGYRVRFVPETRVLADFPVSKEGSETQRARWEGGRFRLQRQLVPRLLRKVLAGSRGALEPLLELMSLPLSYEVPILLLLAVCPVRALSIYGLVGLAIVAGHILAAVAMFGTRKDFAALAGVPGYVLWKFAKLPRFLLASGRKARWIRTKRD
jgi:cellulose synthase/poly-beta-1,6-N-acetylglucosamine synthase-like glycosyltransferase